MDNKLQMKNCEAMQEQLVMLVYGELADEQRHRVEQHIRGCDSCTAEFAAIQNLQHEMHLTAVAEPSASQLAQARMALEEALDRVPAPGMGRIRQALAGWVYHLRAVPIMASLLLLLLGFAGGGFAGLEFAHHAAQKNSVDAFGNVQNAANDSANAASLPAGIANVNGVVVQPGSNLVQVRYNRLVPGTIEAQASDPRIQQLLLLATQNRINPGVRVDSVGLLAAECRDGRECNRADDGRVLQALMASLHYDKNPGVRLKALDGLTPYVAQDEAVRDSVVEALLHDDNPGVRAQAIQMLSPVEADSSVRGALHTVANDDRNPYLRTVSQETLAQAPEIQ